MSLTTAEAQRQPSMTVNQLPNLRCCDAFAAASISEAEGPPWRPTVRWRPSWASLIQILSPMTFAPGPYHAAIGRAPQVRKPRGKALSPDGGRLRKPCDPPHIPTVAVRQPWLDIPVGRRNIMRANKGKHTKPELAVRSMLHALGYRFRLHRRDLPGTPDLVFPGRHAVVQVHGCFWHQHEGCHRASTPVARRDYWEPKLRRNQERDRESDARLVALGWRVATVWECELRDIEAVSDWLCRFLDDPS